MSSIYRRFRDPITAFIHLQAKLQHRIASADQARMHALEILARDDDSEPLLKREEELGVLSAEQKNRLEKVKKLHLREFHRANPLLPDETLEQEYCAALAEPWRDYPKGTVAVVRETSVCREIHLFTYLRLEDMEIRHVPDEEVQMEVGSFVTVAPSLVGSDAGVDFGALAENLYIGLLKGFLGKAGSELFGELFPPGPPTWIQDVYKEVRAIIHDEIEQARLSELEAKLKVACIHVADYNTFRDEDFFVSKSYLEKAYDILVEVTEQLKKLNRPAINIYSVAVAQWFLIMQEFSLVDPKHSGNPLASRWSHLIQERAKDAVEHAEKVRKEIIDTRLAAISQVKCWYYRDKTHYYFEDEGKTIWDQSDGGGCRPKNIVDQCMAAREAYYRKKETEVTQKMAGVATSIKAWRELMVNPLPRLEASF